MIEGVIEGCTKSQDYVRLAKAVIRLPHRSANDLREWWADEKKRREEYGLSESEIADLVDTCRQRVEELRFAIPPSEPKRGRKKPSLI